MSSCSSETTPEASAPSTSGLRASAAHYVCVLTGDRLFSIAHPHEIIGDGLAYRVRGSLEAGICRDAEDDQIFCSDGADTLPLNLIDIVEWAGLKPVKLDTSEFIKYWQRYIVALQHYLQVQVHDEDAADNLLLGAHQFARSLLTRFEEHDILLGASEDTRGPLVVLKYEDDDPLTPQLHFLRLGVRRVDGTAD